MEVKDYVAIGIFILIAGFFLDSIVCNICRTIIAVRLNKLAESLNDEEEEDDHDDSNG